MGLCLSVLVLGVNYLAYWLFLVPLLPEQAGSLVVRLLPLALFSILLHAIGVLARPFLLLSTTVALGLFFTLMAVVLDRVRPKVQGLLFPILVAGLGAAIALAAATPGEGASGVVIEVALLAVTAAAASAARPLAAGSARGVDEEGRRELLRNLFFSAVTLSFLGIGYFNLRRFLSALGTGQGARAVTEVTPVRDFFVVSKNLGGDPAVQAASWRLVLPDAHVLTYGELLALPSQQLELTLECISNDVGGTLISNGVWQGPRLQDLLARAAVPSDATYLLIESVDGYTESIPLASLPVDAMLATHLNGLPLPSIHGFPARILLPGRYGMKQPKWVTRLRVSSRNELGYWEQRGWDERAIVKTTSRIDAPADGSLVAAGTIGISGIAFAGDRRVASVELKWDGTGWHEAELEREFSAYAWRFWHLDVSLKAGRYGIAVRARDGLGQLQSELPAPTLPSGAAGLHQISLEVR